VIVLVKGTYDIFPMAKYSLLFGLKLKHVPPETGTRQQIPAKHSLIVES
jgi:hypothetical protein